MGVVVVLRESEVSDLLHFFYKEDAERYARELLERKENPSEQAVVDL